VFCASLHDIGGRGHLFERDGLLAADPEGVKPGTPELPNFAASDKKVLLGFPRDARAAQVIPHDTVMHYFVMDKVGYNTGHVSKRIYMLSYSESSNRSYMAWSDEWGSPRRHLQLGLGRIRVSFAPELGLGPPSTSLAAHEAKQLTISLSHEGSRESTLIAPSKAEFDGFKQWLQYCAFHAARRARGEEQAVKEKQAGIV